MALAMGSALGNMSSTSEKKDPREQTSEIVKKSKSETKDTFINRTAISPTRYNDVYGTLMGFGSGSVITVEYYKRTAPIISQTGEVDYSRYRHSVHEDYTLIHDFEIKLDGQLNVDYDSEKTIMTITGEGLTYPGFNPYAGDLFLYGLPDNQIGIFVINNAEPLSIQQGSYHKISFKLVEYGDAELENIEKMNQSVAEEVHFDKQKYLSGNATLLQSDEYLQLRTLRRYRELLVQYFFRKYYSDEYSTIMRPDDIYDPYIVEFLHAKVSYLDVPALPAQIYPEVTDYDSSIWFLLTGAIFCDVDELQFKFFNIRRVNDLWDTNITGLTNKKIIHLDDSGTMNAKKDLVIIDPNEEESTYVLSSDFYTGDSEQMSGIELILFNVLRDEDNLDRADFIDNYLKKFRDLEGVDKFYHICLYLYLTDLAIANIT